MGGALSDLTRRARAAWPALAGHPLEERLERARRARASLAACAPAIIDEAVREVGQPRRFARREVESALGLLDALPTLAEAIRPRDVPSVSGRTELHWAPYGVVFGWHAANSPVWVPTLVTQSALVAGNAVLSRPSSRARRTTRRVLDALAAAWPEDAIVVVELPAAEAQELVAHPEVDAVVAHSSSETCKRHLAVLGEAYAAGAPLRPYIPEASGNDALLVLPGADLVQAAEATAIAAFANGGQLCMSAKRIVVEQSVLERFVPLLVSRVGDLVVGDPDDERTDVAPIAEGPARRRAREALGEALAAGGRILVGSGERDGVFTPTIVHLPRGALQVALWRQESFAPLRSLVVAESSADAVALANDSSFGLGAAIFGGGDAEIDAVRGARLVVDTSPLYQDAHLVVGGVKDSGIAGARPKLEQLVFARRVHRETPGGV